MEVGTRNQRTPKVLRMVFMLLIVCIGMLMVQFYILNEREKRIERSKRRAPKTTTHLVQPKPRKTKRTRKALAPSDVKSWEICDTGEMVLYSGAEEPFLLCVHAKRDIISDRIRERGLWDDCEDLVWMIWTQYGEHATLLHSATGQLPATSMRLENSAQDDAASREKTKRKLVIVDVGANIGACAIRLALLGHTIHAFEPLPSNVKLLDASILYNNLSNVFSVHSGVAERAGTTKGWQEHGNTGNTILGAELDGMATLRSVDNSSFSLHPGVNLTTLDLYFEGFGQGFPVIDLLKLDCQGGEYAALMGANGLLKRRLVRSMVVEFSPAHIRALKHSPVDLLQSIHNHGFMLSTLGMGIVVEPDAFENFTRAHEHAPINLFARLVRL